jgi:hypothetical protein
MSIPQHAPVHVQTRRVTLAIRIARRVVALAACCVFAGLSATPTGAQELDPRAYANTPIDMNFAILGYAYSQGAVAVDPSVPLDDANMSLDVAVAGFARSFDWGGKSAKVAAAVPYACLDGSALWQGVAVTRDVCGAGDAKLGVSVNFYGAPPTPLKEFAGYRQDLIMGASMSVTAPTGQYDNDKLVNIGTNRWSLKTELVLSQALGKFILELAGAATFFSDNDDFFGGKHREQAPLYAVQGHIIYSFPHGIWGAVNSTYFAGGRTTLDGVEPNDRLANSRAGATLALPIDRKNSIKLYTFTGVSTRAGGNFDTYGLAWQHRWGGGL